MCAALSPLQTCPAKEDSLFHRGHPGLQCAALAGPAGSAFLFLPVLCPSALPHPPMGRRFSSHPGLPVPLDSSTTAPHGSNGAGLPLRWCRFPISAQKSHTGAHRAEFGLTAFSWSALGLVGLPSPAPTCNLSPPGWDGWRIARCCSGFFHLESVLL